MTATAYAAQTISADGNTTAVTLPGLYNRVTVNLGTTATFGSGTVKVQASPDAGTTWVDVTSASFSSATAATKKADYNVYGTKVRLNVAGSTNPTLDLQVRAKLVNRCARKRFTFTADATGTQFQLPTENTLLGWIAWGTWGSGTLHLQASPDNGTTWVDVNTATANAYKAITDNEDTVFRFKLTGSTSPALTVDAYVQA